MHPTCRLPIHITPEIQRTPLHEVVLTIKLLSLGEVDGFLAKALEPPPQVQSAECRVGVAHMSDALAVFKAGDPVPYHLSTKFPLI